MNSKPTYEQQFAQFMSESVIPGWDNALGEWDSMYPEEIAQNLAEALAFEKTQAAEAALKATAATTARAAELQAQAKARQKENWEKEAACQLLEYKRAWAEDFGVGRGYLECSHDNYEPANASQRTALHVCFWLPWVETQTENPDDSKRIYGADGKPLQVRNIWLLGPKGCGKTHLAVATLRDQFFEMGLTPAFISHGDLIREIRASWSDPSALSTRKVYQKYGGEVDWLVIDDVGTTYGSKKEQEDLFPIFDKRSQNGLGTIITSNLRVGDIERVLGDRSTSRLRDKALILPVVGRDHRQPLVPDLQAKAEPTLEADS